MVEASRKAGGSGVSGTWKRAVGVAVAAVLLSGAAIAQDPGAIAGDTDAPVALVADRIVYDETQGTVTAQGGVEVFQGSRTLTAERIVYDSRNGRIRAEGPLVLREGDGSVLLADAADLDAELRDGIVRGARALIGDRTGTLAAVEGERLEGRFTVLTRAVYTACEVCPAAPVPLWQIRARRVIHDQAERMVHYENAVFDVLGVPVAWLPFFSHPDATVQRKSGFLPPTFGQSSDIGFSVQLPYFVAIDPSRDVTVTPFLTSRDGPILVGEYRQRFDGDGRLDVAASLGALSTGTDGDLEVRGHLLASGEIDASGFAPGANARAGFRAEAVSDRDYLLRYDFSERDRLTSELYAEHYDEDGYWLVAATSFHSLREDEPDGADQLLLPRFAARRDFDLPGDAGAFGLTASHRLLVRPDGRDVARLSLGMDWETEHVLSPGLALRGFAEARGDMYGVWNDPAFDDDVSVRFAPQAGIEARFPVIATAAGLRHLVEPGLMLVVAPTALNPAGIPDEDSLLVEFDGGNVLSQNRFPGFDRVEDGTRMNVGMRYTLLSETAMSLEAGVGRVYRLSGGEAFSRGSGLRGRRSDIVADVTVGWQPWLSIANRLRVRDDFTMRRKEIEASLGLGPLDIATGYAYLLADEDAGIFCDREEITGEARLRVTDNWQVSGVVRHDIESRELISVGGRLSFRNDCTALEFFAGRDYASRADPSAATRFGLRVQILGQADPRFRGAGRCGAPQARQTPG